MTSREQTWQTDGDGSALAAIAEARVVPVVTVDDADCAATLAAALVEGGLPLAEVTFRTTAAAAALEQMAAQPGLRVGAGTVLTPDQVDAAVDAGAQFVVSPGLNTAVLQRCAQRSVPAIPGVATPTETTDALLLGVQVAKLFPAAQLGGPGAVAALAAPFPQMRFIPTGGIGPDSARDYLRHHAVLAVGGSWMVPPQLVRAQDFDRLVQLAREAVAIVSRVEEHV